MELLSMLGGHIPLGQVKAPFKVKGNPTGIRRGWFNWPFNFDPVWLEECEGFTPAIAKARGTQPANQGAKS